MSRVLKLTVSVPSTWETVLEEFLLWKQAEGKAPRTLKDYQNHITAFFRDNPEAWRDHNSLKLAARKHFASLTGKSATTYNLRREYLKAFFGWCLTEGYLPANPVEGLPKRKNEGRPRSIPEDVLRKFISLPDKSTYTGIRDTALILLQVDSGLRPGEALLLTPSCFNLKMLEVEVPSYAAKTREGRTVVISPQTAKAVQRLLSVRPPDWTEDVPVFASQDGTPLSINSWGHRMAQYSKRLRVKVTPYSLRHTAAIESLRNGGNVFYVQRQLGHASLVMTKRYVHLVEGDLHREHSKASPVGNLFPSRSRAGKVKPND
ncbi:MAG: tyrosine-type recombinase/integrase [Bacillota bacterium]